MQKRVYELAGQGKLVELKALVEEHPEVDVDGYLDEYYQRRALEYACTERHT